MQWLFQYMKGYKIRYCLSIFFSFIGGLISNIIPIILLGKMIDVGIGSGNIQAVPMMFIVSILMYIAGRSIAYIGILMIDKIRYLLANTLKVKCYAKLNELDSSFYQNNSLGTVVTILNSDINEIHHGACFVIKQSLNEIISAVLAIICSICISPTLTISILLPTPLIAIISYRYIQNIKKFYLKRREELANLNNYIQENIEGNKLIKTLGIEKSEIKGFKTKNKILCDENINIKNKNIKYDNKITFLSYLMHIILLLIGGLYVIEGHITIGEFAIINSFIPQIKTPFVDFSGRLINDWQRFKISITKVRNLLESKPSIIDNGKKIIKDFNTITFDDVSVSSKNKNILKNINLKLENNKSYAFIGEVGSGKSTIGKILLRLINKSAGNILVDNIPIEQYSIKSLRNKIGYVSQTPFLFSDSIFNNTSFGNKNLHREDVMKYLDIAEANYYLKLPNGIDTVIGENGVTLSGGEKQRLAVARALAKNPSILILDDITSALDYETEMKIMNNISNYNNCMKIIVAQKIISVKNADKIFVMRKGEIVEEGTHDELLQLNGEYRKICNIQ